MTREEAIIELHNCRITSLSKLPHGYVVYENTAKSIIDRVVAPLEQRILDSDDNCYELSQRIKELEAPKTCASCKHMHYWADADIAECTKNEPPINWETMKKLSMFEVTYDFGCINYEAKETK